MARHDDAGAAKGDVAKQVAEEQDKGYFGEKVDPFPNEAYSLESGPDSPTTVDMKKAADAAAKKET